MRILALESGRVIDIEKLPVYGIVVTLETKKSVKVTYHMKYCYLDWVAVDVGDEVTPGQLIGTIPDGKMR